LHLGETPIVTDDQTLRAFLTQAAEGDPEAFARIIERFHDDMARVAFVVSGDGDVESAQVAVRAAWATARRGLGTMGNPERLPAWLMGIAAKQAREATQARGRRREDPAVGESGVAATRASSAPAYRTDQREVANALAPLDAHDRMIVGLRYIAGLDADAIGVELGMPGSAVQARIARVLSELLKDLKGEPTDTIEHYERGLTQLVRSFADLAVVPIDVAAVAQAANEAAAIPEPGLAEQLRGALVLVWEQLAPVRERFRKFNPLDWLLVAGLLVIVVAVVFAGGGPGSGGRATQNPSDATRLCEATELEAHVVAWETTNAYRNATVEMRNVGKDPCLVDSQPEPWLTAWPRDAILIGQERQGTTRIGPGDVLHTIVSVRNYCGAAPKPPVSVAFRQGSTVIAATPLTGSDLSGVPPCGGYPGTKDDIQMRPWAP
jgi:DNA-directed RNA polymerase specialized sigma24 family protein